MSELLFQTEGVTKRYGGLTAVSDVSIRLDAGELIGVIGPNGAGKTTLFNLITGADTVSEEPVRKNPGSGSLGRRISTAPRKFPWSSRSGMTVTVRGTARPSLVR